jgi:hypothetical protein
MKIKVATEKAKQRENTEIRPRSHVHQYVSVSPQNLFYRRSFKRLLNRMWYDLIASCTCVHALQASFSAANTERSRWKIIRAVTLTCCLTLWQWSWVGALRIFAVSPETACVGEQGRTHRRAVHEYAGHCSFRRTLRNPAVKRFAAQSTLLRCHPAYTYEQMNSKRI